LGSEQTISESTKALIELAVYERIQEKLSGKTTTHTKKFLNEDFPLRGFVLCHACGKPDTASWSTGNGGKVPYDRCKTKGCSEHNKSTRKEIMEGQFDAILKNIRPHEQVLALTKVIVADVWKKKISERVNRKAELEKNIEKTESERSRFVQLVSRAIDEKVIAAYEERISSLTERELVLRDALMSVVEHAPSIETALDIVFDFLKNPYKQWTEGDLHAKRLVLKLIFERNLAYNRKSGFETAFLSLPLRVFTLPEAQKPLLVEVGRIELPSESFRESGSTTRSRRWLFEKRHKTSAKASQPYSLFR
jgi:site-specific DNA recombinase